jgi:hypothetical protein
MDWTRICEIVGATYLLLTALAGFCTLLAAATARWPGVAKVFTVVATICGTVAGALHKFVPAKAKDVAVVALLFVCVGSSSACLAGSFEEARLAGVRQRAISAAVSKGQSPYETRANANLAVIAATPSEYCAGLDNGQLWFRAIGTGLTLAAAPAVIPAFALPDDKPETKRAFIVAAGASAVAGGVLLLVGDGKATTWVRDCSAPEEKAQ